MQLKVLKQWFFFFPSFLSHEAEHFDSNGVLLESRKEEEVKVGRPRQMVMADLWTLQLLPAALPLDLSDSSSEAGGPEV